MVSRKCSELLNVQIHVDTYLLVFLPHESRGKPLTLTATIPSDLCEPALIQSAS